METKLNVTKGVATQYQNKTGNIEISLKQKDEPICHNIVTIDFGNTQQEREECIANSKLILDAFNTHNTTGYTPSQLLEQNREYVEALKANIMVIKSLKLSMLAHPDCTDGSEFDDMTDAAEDRNILNNALLNAYSKDV